MIMDGISDLGTNDNQDLEIDFEYTKDFDRWFTKGSCVCDFDTKNWVYTKKRRIGLGY